MSKLLCIYFLLIAATSLCSQVVPSASGGPVSLDDTQMMTPPPVSGDAYAITVGQEMERTNYLSAGMEFTGAYTNNLYLSDAPPKIGDEQYYFQPTFSLNRSTTRVSEDFSYSPGFTIYQHTSQLNGVSQEGVADYELHLAKYTVLKIRDIFSQNSNLYNQPNPFAPGGVSSTGQAANIFPFANLLSNSSSAGIDYQYARNAMIGASASFDLLRYKDQASSSPSLQNQNVSGASAFFSRRLSPAHYTGLTYQFSKIITFPERSYTDESTIMGFFTVYLTRNSSFSIIAGPQHYSTSAPSVATSSAWTPAIQASAGWDGRRASVAGSYSRGVSTTSGLVGAYRLDAFGGGASWQLARRWTLGFGGDYSSFSLVTPATTGVTSVGRTGTGSVSIIHPLTERLSSALAYAHFHQNQGLAGTSLPFPDSDRVTFSINYLFSRPIGR